MCSKGAYCTTCKKYTKVDCQITKDNQKIQKSNSTDCNIIKHINKFSKVRIIGGINHQTNIYKLCMKQI